MWQMLGTYGALAALERETRPRWNLPTTPDDRLTGQAAVVFKAFINQPGRPGRENISRLPTALRLKRENSSSGELAFKTGTSHGFRDAWLAAYNPKFTVVIWAGDPEGKPHSDLVALKALGPVLVPLIDDDLPPGGPWPKRPDDVEIYQACSVSGQPVGPHCPQSYSAFRLRPGAKTTPCRIHVLKAGQVDADWPIELPGFIATLK